MMTTKKAGKSAVVKGKGVVKVHTLEVTPEMLIGGLKRFGTVCDYVENYMRAGNEQVVAEHTLDSARAVVSQSLSAPKTTQSVEQMACEMRSVAEDVAKQASAIRERLTIGVNPGGVPDSAAEPSQGPLKDYVNGTMHFLYSIRRDLDTINQYAIG